MLIFLYNTGTIIFAKDRNNWKSMTDPTSLICNPNSPAPWKVLSWRSGRCSPPCVGPELLIGLANCTRCNVHVLRQKCCCVGLKGSALGVPGDGMFYMIYAPYYLSKIPKFLNSETYTVQAFSVKGIEPVLRATVSYNQRTITFWVF